MLFVGVEHMSASVLHRVIVKPRDRTRPVPVSPGSATDSIPLDKMFLCLTSDSLMYCMICIGKNDLLHMVLLMLFGNLSHRTKQTATTWLIIFVIYRFICQSCLTFDYKKMV